MHGLQPWVCRSDDCRFASNVTMCCTCGACVLVATALLLPYPPLILHLLLHHNALDVARSCHRAVAGRINFVMRMPIPLYHQQH